MKRVLTLVVLGAFLTGAFAQLAPPPSGKTSGPQPPPKSGGGLTVKAPQEQPKKIEWDSPSAIGQMLLKAKLPLTKDQETKLQAGWDKKDKAVAALGKPKQEDKPFLEKRFQLIHAYRDSVNSTLTADQQPKWMKWRKDHEGYEPTPDQAEAIGKLAEQYREKREALMKNPNIPQAEKKKQLDAMMLQMVDDFIKIVPNTPMGDSASKMKDQYLKDQADKEKADKEKADKDKADKDKKDSDKDKDKDKGKTTGDKSGGSG